jgi:hypothetical protein
LGDVLKYVSAEILVFLDLAEKLLVPKSGTAPFPMEFPDGN